MEEKIPVVILTGFLGSGKTTMLNHILKNNNGLKIGVIVNDFGTVNIDSMLVSKQTDNTMELSGGCICCQMSDGGLDETLGTFAHAGSTIDAIIIEASGIAEPQDLRKLILYSSNKFVSLHGVVYLVDAVNFMDQAKQHADLKNHVKSADILVINKIDLIDETQLQTVRRELQALNPNANIIQTSDGVLDSNLLFDNPNSNQPTQLSLADSHDDEHHSHSHLHDKFNSISFSTTRPLSPKKFDDFIKNLDKNIYRLKGVIYYGMKGFEQKIIFHKVGSVTSQHAEEWRSGEAQETNLVAIGVNVDEDKILANLNNCVDENPDEFSADDMVDIMRLKGF